MQRLKKDITTWLEALEVMTRHLHTWCTQKCGLQIKVLGEREVSIRGATKAEVEGGLVEAEGSLFVAIVEDHDITRETT